MRLKSSKKRMPFRVASRKSVFRGSRIQLDILQIRTAEGRSVERELIRHPGAVVIIPRLSDGRLVLIRQLRVSTGQEIWEFPAGTLEKGESIFHCATRELQEETGFKPGRLCKVLEFYPTPGISTEKMYLFFARKLQRVASTACDPDEVLKVETFSSRQLKEMIQRGRIIDGKTILGFLFYKNFLNKV